MAKYKNYTCKKCKHNQSGYCILRHMNRLTQINNCKLREVN